jgi:hypothetical protein
MVHFALHTFQHRMLPRLATCRACADAAAFALVSVDNPRRCTKGTKKSKAPLGTVIGDDEEDQERTINGRAWSMSTSRRPS